MKLTTPHQGRRPRNGFSLIPNLRNESLWGPDESRALEPQRFPHLVSITAAPAR